MIALVVRLAGFAVQAAAADNAWLNVFQYAIPLAALNFGAQALLSRGSRGRRDPGGSSPAPATATAPSAA